MLVISNHLQDSDKNDFAKSSTINSLRTSSGCSGDLQYSWFDTCGIIAPTVEHAKTSISLSSTTTTTKRYQAIPPLMPYNTPNTNPYIKKPYPLIFPLSADHRLITLVQYNVVRAVMFNITLLSIQDHLPEGCMEALGVIPLDDDIPLDMIPPDLQPTPLQNQMPKNTNISNHQTQTNNIPRLPFWIHALPFPTFRDNLIICSSSEACDFKDLAQDLGEGLYKGFDDAERRGLLVWGNPWSGQDWEISDGFVKKWGFLLKGCWDVIEATNRWRELRGEKRLVLEV
jgi:hypothetical protein